MQTYEHRKISAPEAAAYLGISASTLSELRVFGGGPKFHQLGRQRLCRERGGVWMGTVRPVRLRS